MKRICVYCGSKPGNDPAFLNAADRLGREIAKRNIELVYGGANIGLMGRIADAVLDCGGKVTGVIPADLFQDQVTHTGLSELISVSSMHQRKKKMADLADGFIALPGGFGTFEELFEAITWSQLEIHIKPIGVLNINDYYTLLDQFISHSVSSGFIKPKHRSLYCINEDPGTLLETLENLA